MNEVLELIDAPPHEFTLLTNHTHVLVLIAQKPDIRMRELAVAAGITERAVQRIVEDLTSVGYISVTKDGRRNRYEIQPDRLLRHPLSRHRNVGDLIRFVYPDYRDGARGALQSDGPHLQERTDANPLNSLQAIDSPNFPAD